MVPSFVMISTGFGNRAFELGRHFSGIYSGGPASPRGRSWANMTSTSGVVRCPACGKQFPWHAKFAGRKARCACGNVMTYPSAPPMAGGDVRVDLADEGYDLAPDPPPTPAKPIPVPVNEEGHSSPKPVKVLAYRSPGGASVAASDLDTDKIVKQTLPLWFLSGGLFVEGGIAFVRARFGAEDLSDALLRPLLGVGVSTIVMMVGVLIAA